MSDNKDFLTSESEAEKNVDFDTDTTNNDGGLSESADLENQELNTDFNPQQQCVPYCSCSAPEQTAKKKSFVQLPIIISLAIVVVVALGFLVFKMFFNTSIVGAWTVKVTATADEADSSDADDAAQSYYCFDNDGTASVYLGTMKMVGTYTLDTSEEGTRTVTVSVPSALEGTFEYDVTGNAFTGRTLVLTDSYYGQSVDLVSTELVIPEIEPYEDFEPDEKLCETWVFNDSFYNSSVSYEFKEDGTFVFSESDAFYLEGVYTYTDDTITLKYYGTELTTTDLSYQLVDSSIVINGLQYVKDTGSTGDEA